MSKNSKRKCPHCRRTFVPDPYNAHHQRHCGAPECRLASNRASSRKYRRRKQKETSWCEKEKQRVRKWRKTHPGYWKGKKTEKKLPELIGLRDFARGEKESKDLPLRDFVIFQHSCIKGLISHLTGALRDDIGSQLNMYYERGRALSLESNINQKRS